MNTFRHSLFVALLCAFNLSTAFAVPVITATQDDATAAATRVPVGATITYTTTISNIGDANATGVTLTNPTPANTADFGSVTISPIAFDDVYPQIIFPNIGINSGNIPYSVFTNDFAGTPAVTTIASFTQPAHGTLTMVTSGANTGQFTYEPAAGYSGADSFTYTLTNTVGSSVGTVNLTVLASPVIWFVNPSAPPGGTGTLSSPFQTAAQAVTAIGANTSHRIFLYSGAQTTGITLKNNGWLVGQAATGTNFDSVMGIAPPSGFIARPTLNSTKPALSNASGSVVTLADNNTILGVAITGGATGAAVASSGTVNTSLIGNATTSDVTISGAGGGAFSLGAGNGAFNVNAPITSVTGRSVAVTSRTGGTVSFTGAINDTGTGISLTTNTGATINFSGGLSLSTGANPAFSATGGGTVNATQNNTTILNTLTTTTATALNVASTTIGASGLTFRSISSNGGTASGIILDNTGASGGLTVTGDGTNTALGGNSSGGTLANKSGTDGVYTTGCGIYLNATKGVTLRRMTLGTNQNYGIRGTSVNGLTLEYFTIAGTSGTNQATPFNESCIYLSELSGTSLIKSGDVSGGFQRNIYIDNSTGNVDLTVNACNIHNSSAAQGDDGLGIEIGGTGSSTVHVTNNTFSSHGGDHFDFTTLDSPTVAVVFTGNNGSPGSPVHPIGLGQGFRIFGAAFNGTLTYDMSNNTINGTKQGGAMTVNKGSGTGTFSGRVSGNTIGISGQALSGASQSNGINVESRGGGTHTTLVTGNTIRQYREYGINIEGAEAGSTTFNVTCTANTIDEPGSPGAAGLSLHGIQLNWGIDVGNTSTCLLDLGGAGALKNIVPNGGNEPAGGFDIRLRQRQSTTVKLLGYGGANNDNAAVNAYITGRNTITSVTATNTVPTGGGYVNTASVPQPTIPPLLFAPGGVEAKSHVSRSATDVAALFPVRSDAVRVGSESSARSPMTSRESRALPGISQADLDSVVAGAIARWAATGLNDDQIALLRGLKFAAADLPGMRLGEANGNHIRVDNNAGGNAWFVASAGVDDAQFGNETSATRHYTDPASAPAGRIDLLTTILHEMGHALGLGDSYSEQDRDNVMYGFLTKGERRLPSKGQAAGAMPNEKSGPHFLSSPVNIGTLPPGKSVKIVYSVTVGPITGNPQSISSQGSVASNIATVLTSDAQAGSGPTITLLAIAPAFTSANATTFTVGTAGNFSVTANGAPPPTFSFTGTLPSGVTLSAAGVLSGTPAAGTGGTYPITITANNGIAPNGTQSFTLTVNQAPAITSANATTFVVGSAGSFTVTKTGFPAPTLSVTGTLPSGVTFTPGTGVLSGTPAAGTGGSYPISFTAANGVGSNAVQSFTLTVNQAPAITSVNTTTFTVGTPGNFVVTATGFPSPAINLTNGSLPSGVNFGVGTLAGTPTVFGTFPLTFTASNGVGSNATQNFSLIVNPSAATVKSGGKISKDVGGGYQINFVGNPGQQYTVQSVDFLPATLAQWTDINPPQVADANGNFSVIVPAPGAGVPVRFYRAIIP